jgi:hypothetical protein
VIQMKWSGRVASSPPGLRIMSYVVLSVCSQKGRRGRAG